MQNLETEPSMEISDKGLALIKEAEGYHKALPDGRCQAYLDTLAVPHIWTIGWGCTKGITEGLIWTRAKAEQELRKEVAAGTVAIDELVKVPLTQGQYDALASFQYNTGALAKSMLLKKLNKGDYAGAAKEFPNWNKAGGKVWPGLVTRRAAEMALFLSEDEPSPEPAMPQKVDAPPAPVSSAMQSSRTVFGTLLAGLGAVGAYFKEFIAEAVSQISTLAPLREILGGFGVDAAKILLVVTLAGCAYALYARLNAASTGKVG